jgi:hypothetical protein
MSTNSDDAAGTYATQNAPYLQYLRAIEHDWQEAEVLARHLETAAGCLPTISDEFTLEGDSTPIAQIHDISVSVDDQGRSHSQPGQAPDTTSSSSGKKISSQAPDLRVRCSHTNSCPSSSMGLHRSGQSSRYPAFLPPLRHGAGSSALGRQYLGMLDGCGQENCVSASTSSACRLCIVWEHGGFAEQQCGCLAGGSRLPWRLS